MDTCKPAAHVETDRQREVVLPLTRFPFWPGRSRMWDTATGQCLKTLVNEDNKPVYASLASDGIPIFGFLLTAFRPQVSLLLHAQLSLHPELDPRLDHPPVGLAAREGGQVLHRSHEHQVCEISDPPVGRCGSHARTHRGFARAWR